MSAAARCVHCSKPGPGLRLCSRCRKAHFCDAACQKTGWKAHKAGCIPSQQRGGVGSTAATAAAESAPPPPVAVVGGGAKAAAPNVLRVPVPATPDAVAGRALGSALRHSAKAHILAAWGGSAELRATLAADASTVSGAEQWSVFASRDITRGETVLDEEAIGTGSCPDTHPMAAMAGTQMLAMMELARSIVLVSKSQEFCIKKRDFLY